MSEVEGFDSEEDAYVGKEEKRGRKQQRHMEDEEPMSDEMSPKKGDKKADKSNSAPTEKTIISSFVSSLSHRHHMRSPSSHINS